MSHTFSDKITENFIEFKIDGDCAWIEKYYIDPDNGKLFMMLLKESFIKMKENGCKFHMQYVSIDEWENGIKNIEGWSIDSVSDDSILIKCDIDMAPICIANGLLN